MLLESHLILLNWKWMVNLWVGTENILFTEKPDILPFSFGRDILNQGDFAQITCVVTRGDRPLSITWSLKGDKINSDPTLTTTMLGTQASMLVISSVDYQHSGVYTCRAENPAGVSTYSAELKVNGKPRVGTEIYFIYRKTRHCSLLFRERCCQPGRLCTADLCCNQGWQTSLYHLESEGRHYKLWPHSFNNNARNSS